MGKAGDSGNCGCCGAPVVRLTVSTFEQYEPSRWEYRHGTCGTCEHRKPVPPEHNAGFGGTFQCDGDPCDDPDWYCADYTEKKGQTMRTNKMAELEDAADCSGSTNPPTEG